VIDLRQPRRRLRQYESRRRALIVTARTRKQIPWRSSTPLPCASVPASARARPVRAQEPHPPLRRRLDYVGGKTGKTPCTRGGPGQGSAALISRSAIWSKRRSVGNHRFRHDHIHRRRGAPFKEAL